MSQSVTDQESGVMAEISWIHFSVFLSAVLQVPVVGQFSPSVVVREGGEVTLPCRDWDAGGGCGGIDWIFSPSAAAAVQLVQHGQSLSDRLRVTADCSLVLKTVRAEDDGFYTCRQYRSSYTYDTHVNLFVIHMNEQEDDGQVTLSCSVLVHRCRHKLKWTYQDVDKDKIKTWTSGCLATVRFPARLKQTHSNVFKCEVTDSYTEKVTSLTFRLQASGEDAALTQINRTVPDVLQTPATPMSWWFLYVLAAVGSAALIITVVVFITLKRSKGNKMQTEEKAGQIMNSVVTPENSKNTADPEDVVCYASISYTKKTSREPKVLAKNDEGDDEGDAVIYSAVKPSSSPAVSADLSDLYATVNKPKR